MAHEQHITMYVHCRECLDELMAMPLEERVSPQEWSQLDVGWTGQGIQVWCVRHDKNVLDLDFERNTPVVVNTERPRRPPLRLVDPDDQDPDPAAA